MPDPQPQAQPQPTAPPDSLNSLEKFIVQRHAERAEHLAATGTSAPAAESPPEPPPCREPPTLVVAPADQPAFVPEAGYLAPTVRAAADATLMPIYRDLVVAAEGLDKSLGTGLAHLEWLMILEQAKIRDELIESSLLGMRFRSAYKIAEQVNLVNGKARSGRVLLDARRAAIQIAVRPAPQSAPPPPALPSAAQPLLPKP